MLTPPYMYLVGNVNITDLGQNCNFFLNTVWESSLKLCVMFTTTELDTFVAVQWLWSTVRVTVIWQWKGQNEINPISLDLKWVWTLWSALLYMIGRVFTWFSWPGYSHDFHGFSVYGFKGNNWCVSELHKTSVNWYFLKCCLREIFRYNNHPRVLRSLAGFDDRDLFSRL